MLKDQNRIELKVYNSGYDECILRANKNADILAGSLVFFKDNVKNETADENANKRLSNQKYFPSEGFCTPTYAQLTFTRVGESAENAPVDEFDSSYIHNYYDVEDHDTLIFDENKQATYDITSFQPAIILENALQGLGINHKNHNGELVLCRELLAGDVYLMRAVKGRYLPTDRMYAVQTEDGIWVTNEASLPSGATLGMFIGYCQEVYEVTDEMLDVDERPIVDRSNREWSDQSMNGRFVNLVKVRVAKTRMTTPRMPDVSGVEVTYNGQPHGVRVSNLGSNDEVVITYTKNGTAIEGEPTNAGEYDAGVVVTRDNVEILNKSVKLIINQKELSLDTSRTIAIIDENDPLGHEILHYNLVGVISGDNVGIGPYNVEVLLTADPEATGKTVKVSFRLTGDSTKKQNYTPDEFEATVPQYAYPELNIGISGGTYTYDGSGHGVTLSGTQEDDDITITYAKNSVQIGENEPTNAGNYVATVVVRRTDYPEWSDSANIVIEPKQLSFAPGSETTIGKTYDKGLLDDDDISIGNVSGKVNGDDVTVTATMGTVSAINAGPHSVNVSYGVVGDDASNYIAPGSETIIATISKAKLTISGTSVADKQYDGTTKATIQRGTVGGVCSGDSTPEVTASGSFGDAELGTYDIVVSYSVNSNNYAAPNNDTVSATISEKDITVTGTTVASKLYDEGTAAAITAGEIEGMVSAKPITLSASGQFPLAAVGDYDVVVNYIWSGNISYYNLPESTTVRASIVSSGVSYEVGSNGGDSDFESVYDDYEVYRTQANTTELYLYFDSVPPPFTASDIILSGDIEKADPAMLSLDQTLLSGPEEVVVDGQTKQRYTLQVAMKGTGQCKISVSADGIDSDEQLISGCAYYPFVYGIVYNDPDMSNAEGRAAIGADIDKLQCSRFGVARNMPSSLDNLSLTASCHDWCNANPAHKRSKCGQKCGFAFFLVDGSVWNPRAVGIEQDNDSVANVFVLLTGTNTIDVGRVTYRWGFIATPEVADCSRYDDEGFVVKFTE